MRTFRPSFSTQMTQETGRRPNGAAAAIPPVRPPRVGENDARTLAYEVAPAAKLPQVNPHYMGTRVDTRVGNGEYRRRRASTGGHKNKEFSLRQPRRLRASAPGATKTGFFHSDGRGDSARLHWGQQKQGLFTLTAAATARASTGGKKNKDFSLRRPRRLRASPPGATKAGTFHSTATAHASTNHLPPRC